MSAPSLLELSRKGGELRQRLGNRSTQRVCLGDRFAAGAVALEAFGITASGPAANPAEAVRPTRRSSTIRVFGSAFNADRLLFVEVAGDRARAKRRSPPPHPDLSLGNEASFPSPP